MARKGFRKAQKNIEISVGESVRIIRELQELSQNQLALSMGVSPRRINEIVLGKRRVTANTALRLARYFGMSPQFWLGLQMDHDLDVTEDEIAERLQLEVRPYVAVGS